MRMEQESTPVDILRFFSKSANTRAGKGTGEQNQTGQDYSQLDRIPNWRQVLSNFHVSPFTYNGSRYQTIEHVFQAGKIFLVNQEEAYKFTMDSGHPIGQGDGAMAQSNRKLVKLTKEQLQEWDGKKAAVMEEAARAKYQDCESSRNLLLLTYPAQLWHTQLRQEPVRFQHLERIRKEWMERIRKECMERIRKEWMEERRNVKRVREIDNSD